MRASSAGYCCFTVRKFSSRLAQSVLFLVLPHSDTERAPNRGVYQAFVVAFLDNRLVFSREYTSLLILHNLAQQMAGLLVLAREQDSNGLHPSACSLVPVRKPCC